jgi:hypothetical protein
MATYSSHGGHSAKVKMRLQVNGRSLTVVQLGQDFLLVDEPLNHPPGQASVFMKVDDKERCWPVHLPEGISASSKRVTIASA